MLPSDLTTGPVRPLLRSIALPAGVGMFCNTLFNLTDTFFAGRISTEAVAGLSISFPVFFLILATGAGLGTGTTALMANALGARQREEARLAGHQPVAVSHDAGKLADAFSGATDKMRRKLDALLGKERDAQGRRSIRGDEAV